MEHHKLRYEVDGQPHQCESCVMRFFLERNQKILGARTNYNIAISCKS
jgi:hypothetical protein